MAKDGFIIGDRLIVKIQRKKHKKKEDIKDGTISSNIPIIERKVDKRK